MFDDAKGELGLSKIAYNFMGGVLQSADGLAAIFNPTVNSYKRINAAVTVSGATWSPKTISYTGNNRTHMIRIPEPGRLELRLAAGAVRGVQSEVLGHQQLVFIAAADNPLASCRHLTYRDLAEHPFIGPVKDTEYGRLLRRVFDEVGFTEHNTITQSQNTLIRRELILSSVGFFCALRSEWAENLESGELVVLDVVGDPLSLEVRIGSLVDRQISSVSNKFVQYLNELKEEGAFDS